ncbi:hypothetical protein [Gilvimarinus algae]|uniref:Uncharacterized protein n=1 Tax=Gilvimarinus algae TaxID=3058037 RepID=A0ABT8TD57_9GAMM|nr:hypothetical protein [Gilvimarinus sp. SDUM040014]MDO3381504.1 hypothetical protein [Gilvimarinus sp. SDUM040014]
MTYRIFRSLSGCSLMLALIAPSMVMAANKPDIYLNENIGFNVEGYKYAQEEFPCEVDKLLVEKILERGQEQQLNIQATNAQGDIYNQGIPVMAIDIEALVLGSDEHSYGTRSHSNLPSVKVTAALIDTSRFSEGFVQARQSCAIATLNEFNPSSNVLDLGSGGVTVCGAIEKCVSDLGKDVVKWAGSQLD